MNSQHTIIILPPKKSLSFEENLFRISSRLHELKQTKAVSIHRYFCQMKIHCYYQYEAFLRNNYNFVWNVCSLKCIERIERELLTKTFTNMKCSVLFPTARLGKHYFSPICCIACCAFFAFELRIQYVKRQSQTRNCLVSM